MTTLTTTHNRELLKAIPATTDEACAKYGATTGGCGCADARNRGGSYRLDGYGNVCKHTFFRIKQAAESADRTETARRAAEAQARLFPTVAPKAVARTWAKPAVVVEPATVKITTSTTDCTCADRSFSLLADSNEPCQHMIAARAEAAKPVDDGLGVFFGW